MTVIRSAVAKSKRGQRLTAQSSDQRVCATAIAIVMASNEALLFLSEDQTVIAASASFCRAFDINPATDAGKPLAELGHGEWAMPRLVSLLSATAAGNARIEAYELDLNQLNQETRNLVVNASRLNDDNDEPVRLLLAVADVTQARAETRLKDTLLREKTVLLQEFQHRVANSLQIIASILMQSARRVISEEARGQLQNTHHRVMSIAALQRQLAITSSDRVELRAYFTQLCQSLGASLIGDPGRLSIKVHVDKVAVEPAMSTSLGLIVTELVINALKHAFPDDRHGEITIDYKSTDPGWTLSVADNGIGMPVGDALKPGLGTGIVDALTKNLECEMQVRDAQPGTVVIITKHDRPTDQSGFPADVGEPLVSTRV